MPETIYKFQPNRSMYFRGFSGIDSPASLHSASATGFTVSGIFRDPAAFWVLVIFDVDDFYHHPRMKPLPDGDLTGVVLEFDVTFTGAVGYDSPKFPTIDWPFLDVLRTDGSAARIDLSFAGYQATLLNPASIITPNANPTTVTSGSHTAAAATVSVDVSGSVAGDVLTIWFENFASSYTMLGGDNPTFVAAQLAAGFNAYSYAGNAYGMSATSSGPDITITASYPGTSGTTKTAQPGSDGNMIRLYWISTNPSGANVTTANPIQLTGGSSAVTFHVTLDFSALGIDDLQQAWFTFAPELADSAAYVDTQADIVFSNWGITADPNGLAELKVAGPLSVRVEESDAWTSAVGTWNTTDVGWFSKGFAIYSNIVGASITVTYWSQFAHDLWLGTSVYSDRGIFGVTLDGSPLPDLDMMLVTYPAGTSIGPPSSGSAISEAISTRRKLTSGVIAGQHTVVLTVKAGDTPPAGISESGFCYFDFLEACVASDVPDAPGSWTDRSPAIDYDTQHGYQLAPSRLLWMFDKLGFTGGPIDEYVGVFWWNQRVNPTQSLASAIVDFSSISPAVSDGLFLSFGGTTLGKSVFAGETASDWALHFAVYVNEVFAGVWASAAGALLTVTVRSSAAAYQIAGFHGYVNTDTAPNQISITGSLTGSTAGTWVIDPTQTPALNYGAASWHADLYAEAASRGNAVSSAFSLELVFPPDDPTIAGHPGASNTWVSRFADTTAVLTDTGFGDLSSAQCVPLAAPFLAYQKAAYLHLAQLQAAAGLAVNLQFGEFLWWFFQEGGAFAGGTGMAYYDDATSAAATSDLDRDLHLFLTPDDDPGVNGFADANFLADRLAGHVAALITYLQGSYPDASFEILFPNDVNGAIPTPISVVGGKLNAYINFPVSWRSAAEAPFQYLKLEHLAFITSDRNMDRVKASLAQITSLAWPLDKIRYLYTVDNPGVAQWRDYRAAQAVGITAFTPWAFDQLNLIGWDVTPPPVEVVAQVRNPV